MSKNNLVICETNTSTWHYHLRVKDSNGPALCGNENIGWDTEIPVSTYGQKVDHIPESHCNLCASKALTLVFLGEIDCKPEERSALIAVEKSYMLQ